MGLEKSLALAMLRPKHAAPGTALEMTILGTRHPVTVIPESPYDPEDRRLRSSGACSGRDPDGGSLMLPGD